MAKANKKTLIPILRNQWQIVGFLAALGCFLLSIREQTAQTTPYFFVRATLENYIITSIILAIANFVLTKKYMFVAAIPIVYSTVTRILNLFDFYGQWQEIILEVLLFAGVSIIVLCATAYCFDSKKRRLYY